MGVGVGVGVAVAQIQSDSPVQLTFLQLPVLDPLGIKQIRLFIQSLFAVQVLLH